MDDLRRLKDLPERAVAAWGRYVPSRDVSQYLVGAKEDIADGIFHRLAGALTSQRLEILSAEIHSLTDS